jgi:predicted esterase
VIDPSGNQIIERTIEATLHGRYLVVPPVTSDPAPMLVGFHGYAEPAEAQIDRMRAIAGTERWLLVAIQGLNRFYQRRTNDVVAGWMTRQDREHAIEDNLGYVRSIVDIVRRDWPTTSTLVYAGFSQGVAMAFRAAARSLWPASGIIAVGGDVPPEIEAAALSRVRTVLLCHGRQDPWHTAEIFENDLRRLREAEVDVRPIDFEGGHEWSAEVVQAASTFLAGLRND